MPVNIQDMWCERHARGTREKICRSRQQKFVVYLRLMHENKTASSKKKLLYTVLSFAEEVRDKNPEPLTRKKADRVKKNAENEVDRRLSVFSAR